MNYWHYSFCVFFIYIAIYGSARPTRPPTLRIIGADNYWHDVPRDVALRAQQIKKQYGMPFATDAERETVKFDALDKPSLDRVHSAMWTFARNEKSKGKRLFDKTLEAAPQYKNLATEETKKLLSVACMLESDELASFTCYAFIQKTEGWVYERKKAAQNLLASLKENKVRHNFSRNYHLMTGTDIGTETASNTYSLRELLDFHPYYVFTRIHGDYYDFSRMQLNSLDGLQDVPGTCRHLNASNNKLEKVSKQEFARCDNTLESLDVSNNLLRYLEPIIEPEKKMEIIYLIASDGTKHPIPKPIMLESSTLAHFMEFESRYPVNRSESDGNEIPVYMLRPPMLKIVAHLFNLLCRYKEYATRTRFDQTLEEADHLKSCTQQDFADILMYANFLDFPLLAQLISYHMITASHKTPGMTKRALQFYKSLPDNSHAKNEFAQFII